MGPHEPEGSLPGTVALMFTDIEGSVARWEAGGRRFARALALHNAVVRRVVGQHEGFEVRFQGDGFMCAFCRASDALRCAVALEPALAAEEWPEGVGAPAIRVAVHAGEVEVVDGDYVGPTANIAARLLEAAGGGQVLASEIAVNLADDETSHELSLLDLGQRHLRGIARPVGVYLVSPPGTSPSTHAPMRDLGFMPTNLGAEVDEFVGRDRELRELVSQLTEPSTRLLTVTGPGGVGKTRLIQHLGMAVVPSFEHGAWFVELAGVREPSQVPAAVAATLRVPLTGPQESQASELASHLTSRELLLLLDNFEHLVEGAATIGHVLAASPRVKCVVTSRERLRVRGEHVFELLPLGLPDAAASPEQQLASESARLLATRVAEVRGRPLEPEEAGEAVRVCRRVAGLPLALELAASALSHMTLGELARSLDERIDLPEVRLRDVPHRLTSMAAAIDWSIGLLSDDEARVLRECAVFQGGFYVEAAEAVCSGRDTRRALDALRDKSLLGVEARRGRTRYTMLPVIREHCLGLLGDMAEPCSARAALHFSRAARELDLVGRGQARAVESARTDLDNIVAALEWAKARGADDVVRDIVWGMWPVFWMASRPSEGWSWLCLAIDASRRLGDDRALGTLLIRTAAVCKWRHDYEGMRARLTEGSEVADRAGVPKVCLLRDLERASLAVIDGDQEAARRLYGGCLVSYTELEDPWGMVQGLKGLAEVESGQGDWVAAEHYLREALSLEAPETQPWAVSNTLYELGRVQMASGKPGDAARSLAETVGLCRRIGDSPGLITRLQALARAREAAGDSEGALEAWDEAVAVARREVPYLEAEARAERARASGQGQE